MIPQSVPSTAPLGSVLTVHGVSLPHTGTGKKRGNSYGYVTLHPRSEFRSPRHAQAPDFPLDTSVRILLFLPCCRIQDPDLAPKWTQLQEAEQTCGSAHG